MTEAGDAVVVWELVNRFYHTTRKSIQLLVAYHADAAAASLTIMSLLRTSLIPFNVHPVASYDDVEEILKRTDLAQDYAVDGTNGARADELFLLIGLGAPMELTSIFDLSKHVVVVLDSQRPFHLSNLRAEDATRLVLWGSARIRREVDAFFRQQRQVEAIRFRQRRRKGGAGKQKRLRQENSCGSESDDESVSSSSVDSEWSSDTGSDDFDELTPSQSLERIDWMQPEEVPSYMLTLYYASECGGRSCAVDAYELAILLKRLKEPMLWHAAVGVCDLFRRRLIDYGTYLVEMRPLHDAVTLQKSVRRGVLEDVTDTVTNQYHKTASNEMQLHNGEEELLFLLRHFTLWGAIWYHPLTASVLGLHHAEDGEGFVRQLLARCGVSVRVAQQPWREVPQDVQAEAIRLVQAELRHVFEKCGSFIGFPNQIRCITRSMGYSTEVSTFDACILFDSLLAAAPPASLFVVDDDVSSESANALVRERLQEFNRERFWQAHAVLDMDPSYKAFNAALMEAFNLQRSIGEAVAALMEPGIIQSTKGMHYTQPSDPTKTTSALESFGSVYRLSLLSNHLLYTLTTERGLGRYTRAVRPLLLSCAVPQVKRKPPSNTYGLMIPARTESGSTAITSTSGGGGHTGGTGGLSIHPSDDVEYIMVLTHAGTTDAGIQPLPAVGRLNACLTAEEEFAVLPRRPFTQRNVALVDGRDAAMHVAELMHLQSLERWNPRRDRGSVPSYAGQTRSSVFADLDIRGGRDDADSVDARTN